MPNPDDEQMRLELRSLLDSARGCELAPADFATRLESIHARFLASNATTPEMLKRRRDAAAAYDDLIVGADMDRHHHLELLAQAIDLPHPP
jgi:hypothetical protein